MGGFILGHSLYSMVEIWAFIQCAVETEEGERNLCLWKHLWGVLSHAFDPSILEADASESLSLGPAWST